MTVAVDEWRLTGNLIVKLDGAVDGEFRSLRAGAYVTYRSRMGRLDAEDRMFGNAQTHVTLAS